MVDLRKGIQSIEIGFRILECLERTGRPLTLTEIGQQTAMTVGKVHFYLISLTRAGLVIQDERGGRYRFGPAALRMGLAALAQLDLLGNARTEMARLREHTGDTVFVSVWSDAGPTVVSRLDGKKMAPLEVRVGGVMPLLTSATGKSFLAWLPRRITAPFMRRELRGPRSAGAPRNAREVERVIADARSQGLTRALGTVIPGDVTLAAPVVDHEGTLQCVVTLMGRQGGFDARPHGEPARALRESVRAISRAAGFTGEIWKPQPRRDGIKPRRH